MNDSRNKIIFFIRRCMKDRSTVPDSVIKEFDKLAEQITLSSVPVKTGSGVFLLVNGDLIPEDLT